MKLPDFFKGHKHKSEGGSDSVEELERPGNATYDFDLPSGSLSANSSETRSPGNSLPTEVIPETKSGSKLPANPKGPEVKLKESEIQLSKPAQDSKATVTPTPSPTPSVPSSSPNVSVQREPDSIESIWFSLIDNPNNEKNLKLLVRYCETRKGPSAVEAALSELAMEKDAYLPQLIMASRALERKAPSEALHRYEELLAKGDPNDYCLLRMSAELGRHGFPGEVIRLTLPRYNPAKHNEYIGLNLLQACKDSGKINEGRAVWAKLKSLDRPGITPALENLGAVFGPAVPKPVTDPSEDSSIVPDSPSTEGTTLGETFESPPTGSGVRADPEAPDFSSDPLLEVDSADDRPRIIDLPSWKLWIPALRDILPEPEHSVRVGLYLYSDTSTSPSDGQDADSRAVAVGLPILLGEMLLFSAPVVPVVLFPLSFSKGPDSGVAEPDVEGLFALCAKESLNFLIAGTVSFDGDRRTIRTWILDRTKNTARVLSGNGMAGNFGESALAHVDEIIGPFSDKNYAFEVKRRGFTYSVPSAPLIERHLDALTRLGLRALVDSGYCSSDILCPQPEFLEKLAELCRMKPFSQNYLMMLLSGMVSDMENGGESYFMHRELLFDTAHKLQYTPCVTTARKALDKVLTL
ncbi:MAG: hypothetical protein JW817_00210 [Clostridiales bacterium]|nr:hypothetical protein [Clostridiales bacterium]